MMLTAGALLGKGRAFVLPGPDWHPWKGGASFANGSIPALHVTTQPRAADIAALLAVMSERRALVCSPREALDLTAADLWEPSEQDIAQPLIDLIDILIIAGFDDPLHPEHVRSLVEQGRAAGVPVIFAGWGRWLPQDQGSGPFQPTKYVFLNRDGRICTTGDSLRGGDGWVGVGRVDEGYSGHVVDNRIIKGAGALLDGQPVCDWPAWLGGEA